jgi:hypothetical protein
VRRFLIASLIGIGLSPPVVADVTGVFTQPEGVNGSVQVNKNRRFYGDTSLVYSTSSHVLSVPGITVSTITINGVTYYFPTNQTGGYFLKTDGAGGLTWATPSNFVTSTGAAFGVWDGAVNISTPTSDIALNAVQFIVSLQGTTTAAVSLDPSSVTLLGVPIASPPLTLTGSTFALDKSSVTLRGPDPTLGGDLSGTISNAVVANNSHTHDGSTISNLDISEDTNLAVTAPVVLTNDTVSIDKSSVTLAGNTFNGASQLVKTDAFGKYPALDGSQITNISLTASGDNLGSHIATKTISAPYGMSITTIAVSQWPGWTIDGPGIHAPDSRIEISSITASTAVVNYVSASTVTASSATITDLNSTNIYSQSYGIPGGISGTLQNVNGGMGITSPSADIYFIPQSGGKVDITKLAVSTVTASSVTVQNITINGTCTGTGCGGGSVTLISSGIAFGSSANTITSNSSFTYIASSATLQIGDPNIPGGYVWSDGVNDQVKLRLSGGYSYTASGWHPNLYLPQLDFNFQGHINEPYMGMKWRNDETSENAGFYYSTNQSAFKWFLDGNLGMSIATPNAQNGGTGWGGQVMTFGPYSDWDTVPNADFYFVDAAQNGRDIMYISGSGGGRPFVFNRWDGVVHMPPLDYVDAFYISYTGGLYSIGNSTFNANLNILGDGIGGNNLLLKNYSAIGYGTTAPGYPLDFQCGGSDSINCLNVTHSNGVAIGATGTSNNPAITASNNQSGTESYAVKGSKLGGSGAAGGFLTDSSTGIYASATSGTAGLFSSNSGRAIKINQGSIDLAGSEGVSGQFLKSNGAGATPSWGTAAGGGASALAVTTGTASAFGWAGSSPTSAINLSSSSFSLALTGGATAFVTLNSTQVFSKIIWGDGTVQVSSPVAGSGAGTWGAITGTLSAQTDLNTVLNSLGVSTQAVAVSTGNIAVSTGTLFTRLVSVGVSTAAIAVDTGTIMTRLVAVGVSTAAIAVDTGTIATRVVAVGVSTAAIAVDTGTLTTRIVAVGVSTAALAVSTGTLSISTAAIAVSTGTNATAIQALKVSTGTIALSTGTLSISTAAIAVSTGQIAAVQFTIGQSTFTLAQSTGNIVSSMSATYFQLKATQTVSGANTFSSSNTFAQIVLSSPTVDHTATGIEIVLISSDTMAFGDVGRIVANGAVHIATGSAIASSSATFMCADATCTGGSSANFLFTGIAKDASWSWIIGASIFLSATGTSGNTLTQTPPAAANNVIQILGVAIGSDRILFMPNLMQVEHI